VLRPEIRGGSVLFTAHASTTARELSGSRLSWRYHFGGSAHAAFLLGVLKWRLEGLFGFFFPANARREEAPPRRVGPERKLRLRIVGCHVGLPGGRSPRGTV
jgi:hypothetical protein